MEIKLLLALLNYCGGTDKLHYGDGEMKKYLIFIFLMCVLVAPVVSKPLLEADTRDTQSYRLTPEMGSNEILRLASNKNGADKTPQEMVELGRMYYEGDGVERDYEKSVYWYRKAAEQGYADGQYWLGVIYRGGYGVEKDYEKSVYWFRKAAEQGDASGQNNLGAMYNYGEGVEEDYEKAVYWYRKAAEQGDASGQNNLGAMYNYGEGVIKDYEKAVYWYQKAAEQGDEAALNNLGYMYELGRGVIKNKSKAYTFLLLAVAHGGYGEIEKYRDRVEAKLTSAEVKKAQELAERFLAQFEAQGKYNFD